MLVFHILGIIIPTDYIIFFRGVQTTNQKIYVPTLIFRSLNWFSLVGFEVYCFTSITCNDELRRCNNLQGPNDTGQPFFPLTLAFSWGMSNFQTNPIYHIELDIPLSIPCNPHCWLIPFFISRFIFHDTPYEISRNYLTMRNTRRQRVIAYPILSAYW